MKGCEPANYALKSFQSLPERIGHFAAYVTFCFRPPEKQGQGTRVSARTPLPLKRGACITCHRNGGTALRLQLWIFPSDQSVTEKNRNLVAKSASHAVKKDAFALRLPQRQNPRHPGQTAWPRERDRSTFFKSSLSSSDTSRCLGGVPEACGNRQGRPRWPPSFACSFARLGTC